MKSVFIALILLFLQPVFAINTPAEVDCYITVVKNDCWKNTNATITLTNLATKEVVASVVVPTGELWSRKKTTCTLGTALSYSASYSPVFWQSDKGKVFYSDKYWTLPESMQKGQQALTITICFPEQFVGTPIPPDATSKCKCDPSIAPPVKLNSGEIVSD